MTTSRIASLLAAFVVCAAQAAIAAPAPPPAALASPVPVPSPSALPSAAASAPVVSPLNDAQLKNPDQAFAAVKRTLGGDSWSKSSAIYVSGVAQLQNQSLAFTYAADLRTGYNRMIVLLPHNAGTYEYGVDQHGGWSAAGGFLHPFNAPAAAVKTSMYVNRFGFLNPADAATTKEVGVDPKLGDRVIVTPAGGNQVLVLLKPATSLISAVQYANGQIDVYADYRRVDGLLYPFRMMQGSSVQNLSIFQANRVEFSAQQPLLAAVSRPALPIARSTPAPKPTKKP